MSQEGATAFVFNPGNNQLDNIWGRCKL